MNDISRAILETEDGFLFDDLILPEIEPIETIPVNIPGLLYLPEHGIEAEVYIKIIVSKDKNYRVYSRVKVLEKILKIHINPAAPLRQILRIRAFKDA